MKLTSVLLAGGQNKRMNGIPKWQLKIGHTTMLERAVAKLKLLSEEILIVSGGEHLFEQYNKLTNLKIVYDKTPYLGPLNGILTSLNASNNDYNFIVAADMPFFSIDLARYMFDIAKTNKYEIVVPTWKGKIQPLHGIYHTNVIHSIEADIQQGKNSLMKWLLDEKNAYLLNENEVTAYNEHGRTFFNMNYPDEYSKALEWINEEDKRE